MLIKFSPDLYIMRDKIVCIFSGDGMNIKIRCVDNIEYKLSFQTYKETEDKLDYIYKQINMS